MKKKTWNDRNGNMNKIQSSSVGFQENLDKGKHTWSPRFVTRSTQASRPAKRE